MYTQYESSTIKRFLKYIFGVSIVLRILSGFVIGYLYLRASGEQVKGKGGTFVEGIFGQISYLPYLKTDPQSTFYQSFLFRSCLNPYIQDEQGHLAQDLCKVYTDDNKKFIMKISDENAVWSDGLAVNIEDIFFTYDEIIRQNKRGISSLNAWNGISVALEDGKVTIEFPMSTPDNIQLFTIPILPRHILQQETLENYRTNFALAPITDGCASILPQTKDINSLIFDLGKCKNTNLSYYQIKNYDSFDSFVENNGISIVDVYESPYELEGYQTKNILTSTLMGIFFNTDSEKMKIRVRRSLGGLIHAKFYKEGTEGYLTTYNGAFGNLYFSQGETIKDLINRVSLDTNKINTLDLKESGAKELPESISINGVDRKFTFFIEKPKESLNLEIKFSNEFTGITIISPDGTRFTPQNYKSTDKKVLYKLTPDKNMKIGSNQYTIEGTIKGKTYTIASLDIYVFEQYTSISKENHWKINILYYSDPTSLYIVQRLKDIFKSEDISEYFIFEEVLNPEELEGKLLMGTYDMYIGSIDLGNRSDILVLFGTEDSLSNPSKYSDPILTSFISQYQKTPNEATKNEINNRLATDMPVIFLGNSYKTLQIKDKVADEVFSGQDTLKEKDWRSQIYMNYSIIKNVRINWKNAMKRENFIRFLQDKTVDLQDFWEKKKNQNLFDDLVRPDDEPRDHYQNTNIVTQNLDPDSETPGIKTLEDLISSV